MFVVGKYSTGMPSSDEGIGGKTVMGLTTEARTREGRPTSKNHPHRPNHVCFHEDHLS